MICNREQSATTKLAVLHFTFGRAEKPLLPPPSPFFPNLSPPLFFFPWLFFFPLFLFACFILCFACLRRILSVLMNKFRVSSPDSEFSVCQYRFVCCWYVEKIPSVFAATCTRFDSRHTCSVCSTMDVMHTYPSSSARAVQTLH